MIRLRATQKTELPAERHGKMCLIHGDVPSAKYLRQKKVCSNDWMINLNVCNHLFYFFYAVKVWRERICLVLLSYTSSVISSPGWKVLSV